MTDRPLSSLICFDSFELELHTGELRKEGRRIKLQEQPFRVLSLLVSRPGALVTREELHKNLWPADTFVDFDHGLNSAIARLREALRDSADKPRYIETEAKRGYRFIARLVEPEQAALGSHRDPDLMPQNPSPETHNTRKLLAGALLCLALVGAVAVGAWTTFRGSPDAQLARIEVVPVGPLRGFQATPAISSDGTLVAFRQSGGANDTGLYVAIVGGDKPLQLTNGPGDCCPTWSPDGRQVAFTRYSEKPDAIYIVPALGGTEHRVYSSLAPLGGGVTWSADGRFLAFTESTAADPRRATVSVLSLADSSVRPITSPPPGWLDHEPAFSPDGTQLAFVRSTVAGVSNDVYVMPATGGQARRLTFDNRPIMGAPTWTPDSHELVFSSNRGGATGLWRISAGGGEPRPLAGPVGEAMWPSIPAKGGALVYEQTLSKLNIWRLNLKSTGQLERPPSAIIAEKGEKMRPELSPDGKKIAFESNRLGFWDIWTCNTDSSDCQQVTSLHGTAGRARWSPDGHSLAFEFHPGERGEIYVVEVPGGTPRLIRTIPGADNLSPNWSRDGKWLYFASKRGNEPFQAWKIPAQGGSPIQLTKNGGISPVESPDGRYLYYSKYEQGGLWRLPLRGGDENEILSDLPGHAWPNWAVTPSGIYFLEFGKSRRGAIKFLDLASLKILTLWTLENEPGWGLSVSCDGKSIVYIQDEYAESSIMMVKNFR